MEKLHKNFITEGLESIQRRKTIEIVDANNTVVN